MDNLCMIELCDAEARLPELINRVEDGEEVLIARGDRPAALLSGLTDDPATEGELVWEWEIRFSIDDECSSEVELYASIH